MSDSLKRSHSCGLLTKEAAGEQVVLCGWVAKRRDHNFKKSMHYNPFAYIHSEKDILKLVTTLIANTKGEGKAGDDFWVKAETLLYCALIGYIHYCLLYTSRCV